MSEEFKETTSETEQDNLRFLAGKAKDSRYWGPKEVLLDAIAVQEKMQYTKCLVVFLETDAAAYDTHFVQCGMSASQLLALLEVLKLRLFNDFLAAK